MAWTKIRLADVGSTLTLECRSLGPDLGVSLPLSTVPANLVFLTDNADYVLPLWVLLDSGMLADIPWMLGLSASPARASL